MDMDIEDFIEFCERIEVKDNDLLIFKCTKNFLGHESDHFMEIMSDTIKKKISDKVVIVLLGPDIESIVQIPEEEMNKIGYFKRDETAKEAP